MAKVTDYAAVTSLLEGMYFYTAIDTNSDGTYESRKVSLSSVRSRLLESQVVDGPTAVAFDFDTANNLADNAALLARWKNNGVVTVAAINTSGQFVPTIGIQEKYVSHTAMTPTVSNGCGAAVAIETTAGRPDVRGLPFDGAAIEYAEFEVPMPKKWDKDTFTARFYWSTDTAVDTDSVIWGIQAVTVSHNATIDVAYGTAVEVNDQMRGAVEELYISDESAEITAGGSNLEGDMLFVRVYRDAVSDVAVEDAILMGVKFFFNTTQASDA